ncbi:peptide/nickel transport system ATP-binding protein [Serratia fonticola]|uniref:Peptide/nickel transport system ATP-binding protein n=1 Tax=Serratia fonticola TaxID=47917 RepID=A0A542BRU1_SERFO|nr:ABC transporter ATP-binding protein [Serratia fonticola]TQI81207.1 peptide/nickel transport system ATP-binding protein [Serratia fonticola]TQI96769.1 peptide/nickel transport system ATP-binding protein [Serratia fonticola]TVZ71265.1 peptide/nickel transport system ATP-binding protein [Serratia fonticola]
MRSSTIPLLELENVSIAYQQGNSRQRVVHQVSFTVQPGEVVALVGESGSGKTTTAQAIIGLLAENGHLEQGAIRLNGTDISHWSTRQLDAVRGAQISLIPQDPASSLNPVKTIGEQVAEIINIHRRLPRKRVQQQVVALLTRVGLSHPEQRVRQYPHELSGGMKQRVLIAIAIALQPALIIADEPTSALDVTVQKRILDLIDELRQEFGTAVLLVTHDLGVAAERADRLLVFRHGRVQEQGQTATILRAPAHDYTRRLFADVPSLAVVAPPAIIRQGEPAIVVNELVKDFPFGARGGRAFRALDRVSFSVQRGTTHALVGESGSGKTTLARCLLGFQRPDAGQIIIDGVDIAQLKGEALRQFRRRIQLVYQNPFGSLDPSQTLYQAIEEPLLNFEPISRAERYRRVRELFDRVALPAELLTRKPRELSGGQRQRVAIARALILQPQVLVLDEATSALDVTVQGQILRLLQQLQREFGLTYLFISHDLATVRQLSHSISVLCRGQQVDAGATADVFALPGSDYTRQLIAAIPGHSLYQTIKDAS